MILFLLSIPPPAKRGLLPITRPKRLIPFHTFNSPPREAGIATTQVNVPSGCWNGFQFHPARSGDCYQEHLAISDKRAKTFNSTPREAGIATPYRLVLDRLAPYLSIPPRAKRGLLRKEPNMGASFILPFNSTPREAGIATAPQSAQIMRLRSLPSW